MRAHICAFVQEAHPRLHAHRSPVTKSDLYPLIADLRSMGYSPADIARAVKRSRARITQILADMGMGPKRLRIEDLPLDLRERITRLTNESETA